MPFYQEIQQDRVSISFWRISEREDEMLLLLPHQHAYAATLGTFQSESRRREWLAARCLFHRRFGAEATLTYLPTGRPLLRSESERAAISISHTGEWVALAVAPEGQAIGLDIERLGGRAYRVRHRFLTADELPLATDETAASVLWSAKEAVYKLCDREGLRFLGDMLLRRCGEGFIVELPTLKEGRAVVTSFVALENCVVSVARWA